jgi:hypothetical protein
MTKRIIVDKTVEVKALWVVEFRVGNGVTALSVPVGSEEASCRAVVIPREHEVVS